jgi:DNA polymerase III, gamma/tau subunit dnaX
MQFTDVIGQYEARERLLRLVAEHRVPHAMLFTGPEGSGKLALALAFASYLLGERYEGKSVLDSAAAVTNAEAMLRKFEHPDLHFSYPVIRPRGSSSERKVTSDDFAAEWRQLLKGGAYFTMNRWMALMGAENQQSAIFEAESDLLSHKLNMKSSMGGYKISVVWLAERMNVECSNKLLKLLEEPPQKTVFLLVSEAPGQLLETIRSRVQRFDVRRISDEDIEQALTQSRGIDAADARRIARSAGGNWLKALEALDADNENRQFFSLFVMLMRKAYVHDVKELKHWSEAVSTFGREKQLRMLAYFLRMVRENFVYNFRQSELCYMSTEEEEFAKNFARFINERNVVDISQRLQRVIRDIGQNANGKIQFFNLALEMAIYLRR